MTVLDKRAASGIDTKGLRAYLVTGAIALVVGVGAAWAYTELTTEVPMAPATVDVRSAAIGQHLDELWSSGLAQQAAINQARILQGRVESGLAQQKAMQDARVLQGRIESGLAQQSAIESARSAHDAMVVRGDAVADHLEGLIESGLAQQAAIAGR